ncbi:MAG: hypothetical protein ACRDP6_09190, partial [Actinoallomurus sp.]
MFMESRPLVQPKDSKAERKPLARTPFEAAAQSGAARYGVSNGWLVADYEHSAFELEVLLARVALADATPHGRLLVQGDVAEAVLSDV